jgi:hypothetical protein
MLNEMIEGARERAHSTFSNQHSAIQYFFVYFRLSGNRRSDGPS